MPYVQYDKSNKISSNKQIKALFFDFFALIFSLYAVFLFILQISKSLNSHIHAFLIIT